MVICKTGNISDLLRNTIYNFSNTHTQDNIKFLIFKTGKVNRLKSKTSGVEIAEAEK